MRLCDTGGSADLSWLYVAKPKPVVFTELDAFFTPSSDKDRFRTRLTYKLARLSVRFWAGPYYCTKVSIRAEVEPPAPGPRLGPYFQTIERHRSGNSETYTTRGRVLFSLFLSRRFYDKEKTSHWQEHVHGGRKQSPQAPSETARFWHNAHHFKFYSHAACLLIQKRVANYSQPPSVVALVFKQAAQQLSPRQVL